MFYDKEVMMMQKYLYASIWVPVIFKHRSLTTSNVGFVLARSGLCLESPKSLLLFNVNRRLVRNCCLGINLVVLVLR